MYKLCDRYFDLWRNECARQHQAPSKSSQARKPTLRATSPKRTHPPTHHRPSSLTHPLPLPSLTDQPLAHRPARQAAPQPTPPFASPITTPALLLPSPHPHHRTLRFLSGSFTRATMSWNGFKKAINRAGTSVMMKAGQVERTIDKEYGIEERRYRTMESAANKLNTEAKGYLDSLRAMTASQTRIAETIDAFYGDAGTRDGVSKYYLQAVQELDSETVKALDGPFRETVLDPIMRFCAYFTDVNEAIKKRSHKCLDYDALRAKVRKLTEKPSDDASKLPRAERELQAAKDVYDQLNQQLITELPQLIDIRVPYLDPSFEALVKIQLRFCTESYTRLAQVQQYLDASTREEYANGQLDARVEQVLVGMRDLSITSLGG